MLKRYVDGAAGEPFFQKRAPEQRPEWIETVELRFPSGRTAREIVARDAAQLLWMVNLGCIDLNPHLVRADDLEHPDELRVDLDPGPGVSWDFVRRVTLLVRDVLDEHGLRGWPKTSGSRGMHVNVRIQRRWSFAQVRRAALALAREVERRAPDLASARLPVNVAWLDLLNPVPDETAFVARTTGLHVPTIDELSEIESSSRLRHQNGAI